MNKIEILKLLRECVIESVGQYSERHEGCSDGCCVSYTDHNYVDVEKMLAAIDSRLSRQRKNETKSIGPDPIRMG